MKKNAYISPIVGCTTIMLHTAICSGDATNSNSGESTSGRTPKAPARTLYV